MQYVKRLALAGICLGAQWPAQAVGLNQMSATAFENAVVTDTRTSGPSVSVPVTAAVSNGDGQAAASATLLQLQASAISRSLETNHFDGDAAQFSSFTFWNTATDSAYAASELAGRALTLQFSLAGEVTMPGAPTGGLARSTAYTYSTELYTSGLAVQSGGGSLACGPSGCLNTGDTLLMGTTHIDQHFALTQTITSATGLLFTHLSVFDGGGTNSALTLGVTGAFVSGDSAMRLALRFADGSQLVVSPVAAVPEPGSLMLVLAGLAIIWGGSRLQRGT